MTKGEQLMWDEMLESMRRQIVQLETEYCYTSQSVRQWELEQEIDRLKHDVNYISAMLKRFAGTGVPVYNISKMELP